MSSTRIDMEAFIEALFEKNKAIYGDARMELDESEETPEEKPEGEPEGDPEEKPEESEEKPEEKSPEDDLPEWAQKEREKLRAEAANYRTRLREAEQKLSDAKTPEEVEAAISELREQNAKLERKILVDSVAREFKLPDDLAEFLKGDDEETLKAHAKVLAKYAPVTESLPDGELEGGLDPLNKDDGEMNPRALASRVPRK